METDQPRPAYWREAVDEYHKGRPRRPIGNSAAERIESSRTIQEPPEFQRDFEASQQGAPKVTVNTIRGDQVKIQAINWAWDGYLARGKMHLIAGAPEAGKTNCLVSFGATMSREGARWPDGTLCTCTGNVLIWSGEDGIEDTLAPRFVAAGADMSRIHFVTEARENGKPIAFDPSKHVDALVARAKAIGDVVLILVDPIISAIAGDSHKAAETRRGLQPLVDCAEELEAVLVGVTHFSKGTSGRSPLERLVGSQAFGAVARVVFAAAKNDGDDEGPERIFVRAKSNIGPSGGGFGYSLRVACLPLENGRARVSHVQWGDALEGTASALLAKAETKNTNEADRALDVAKTVIRALLADGPMNAKEAYRELEAAGVSERTAKRAKKDLGVIAARTGFGPNSVFVWSLPDRSG